MKRPALVVLLALPLACSANEYKFDLGTIEGDACSKTEFRKKGSSTTPVPERTYARKLTRLIATVEAQPDSEDTAAVVNDCGASAGSDLKKTRSRQNLALFSDLFEEYMVSCVSQANPDISIEYAVVESEEKCEQ